MKNVVYRLFGLVAISFCVCLAQAEDVWTLVTDASTLQIGDKVVIVSSVDITTASPSIKYIFG